MDNASKDITDSVIVTSEILTMFLYGKKDSRGNENTFTEVPRSVFVPPQLRIQSSSLPGEALGVFSATWIRSGTVFGPVVGRSVAPSDQLSPHEEPFAWEVWGASGDLSHHTVVDLASWTAYVTCARHGFEQNLVLVQRAQRLFFQATKLIRPGEELLVWYGSSYSLYLGLPELTQPRVEDEIPVHSRTCTSHPLKSRDSTTSCRCVICRRSFNSRSNLRSHMRIHTLEKPFLCTYCQKSFSQSSTLRNHTRLHTGEKPYTCVACDSSYSQLAGLRAHQKSARHRMPLAHPVPDSTK